MRIHTAGKLYSCNICVVSLFYHISNLCIDTNFRKSKVIMDRGGGGLFMKLAPELLLVFLKHLYLHDIAKLRCVSKW